MAMYTNDNNEMTALVPMVKQLRAELDLHAHPRHQHRTRTSLSVVNS